MLKRRTVLRDYQWSSYPDYVGLREAPPWLTVKSVLERNGLSVSAYRRELDRRITQDELGLDWKGELSAGILMGSREVIGEWKRLLAKRNRLRSNYEHRRFGLITWEEIVAAIEQEWAKWKRV